MFPHRGCILRALFGSFYLHSANCTAAVLRHEFKAYRKYITSSRSISCHTQYLASGSKAMASSGAGIQQQNFDFFLVLDFEATCERNEKIFPQEIIEFPVLKVSSKTFQTESTFHQYVQPRVHKELTPFCTELTGIIQEMVDGQPCIEDTLESFFDWMRQQGLLDPDVKSVFVTCGDWDLKVMLPHQTSHFNIEYPQYLKKWINIKKPFAAVMQHYPKGMMEMLQALGLKHEGRHHSGIDDCKNIARILQGLAQRGHVFHQTGSLE